MGLLETEIKELRDMNKQLMDGKIKPAEVNARVAIYSQTEKRAKMLLQAYALSVRQGPSVLEAIKKTNLIGDDAIDTGGDPELEKIKCPYMQGLITRSECLDISGHAKAPETCEVCKNYGETRKALFGGKE